MQSLRSLLAGVSAVLIAAPMAVAWQASSTQATDPARALRPMFLAPTSWSPFQTDTNPAALRERPVELNAALLGMDDRAHPAAVDQVELNLFDDITLTAVYVDDTAAYDGGWVRRFELLDDEFGHAYFSVHERSVSAVIWVHDRLFKVRTVAGGQHVLREEDPDQEPGCGTERRPASVRPGQAQGEGAGAGGTRAMEDYTVDVMVVYTLDAALVNGGHSGMVALVNLGYYETNQGYAQSDVLLRINLVHVAQANYTEISSETLTLSHLQNPTDGHMDEIHALRAVHGADLVALVYKSGIYCGVAFDILCSLTPGFASSGFCVVNDDCFTGNYTFAHELGHLMGAQHDPANTSGCTLTSNCYGYRTASSAYRSIMAYPPGTRVNFWSNPGKYAPNGEVLGTSGANNTSTLDASAAFVAGLVAAKDEGQQLTTTFAANNGSVGNMFDIEPKTDLHIKRFGIHTSAPLLTTVSAEVWYRVGSYQGHESSSTGWTRLGSGSAFSLGAGNPTTIAIANNYTFAADQTYGIYVNLTSYDGSYTLRYTNATGPNVYEDHHLKITTGVGKAEGWGGAVFFWRQWNGTISYEGANGQRSLETTFLGANGASGIMFQVDAATPLTINSFDVNINSAGASGLVAVDVFYRTGSYVGHEQNPNSWTYLGTDFKVFGAPANTPTRIAVGDITLGTRSPYSFYIHLASSDLGPSLRYGNGSPTYSNSDLSILPGVGRGGNAFNSSIYPNRYFEGAIHYSFPSWINLGKGLPATTYPGLSGSGEAFPGQPITLDLVNAPASTPAVLIVGLSRIDAPFKGGTMVPSFSSFFTFGTNLLGEVHLAGLWPSNIPQGTAVYLQYWIPDAGMPQGYRASNGLQATTQ